MKCILYYGQFAVCYSLKNFFCIIVHNFLFPFQKNGVDYIKYENPDIFCLQETKCSEDKLPPEVKVDGYHTYWLSGNFNIQSSLVALCGIVLH